jgi:hypothetical protein
MAQKTLKILLIGNSMTYFNAMPKMLELFIITNNINDEIKTEAFPGYRLINHVVNYDDIYHNKIKLSIDIIDFDVIILQEGFLSLLSNSRKRVAENIIKSIVSNSKVGCKIIFFEPFAVLQNFPFDPMPDTKFGSFTETNIRINNTKEELQSYEHFCKYIENKYSITISSVGDKFDRLIKKMGKNELFDLDGHPTILGSLVIAYSHFIAIYNFEPKIPKPYEKFNYLFIN